MTLIDELTSTEEGRREWQKESATVDATEAICSLMESQAKAGEWVANKIGVSKRTFTRMLSGDGNITIRQLADIFAVLGAELKIVATNFNDQSQS